VSFTEHRLGQGRVPNFYFGDNGMGLGRQGQVESKIPTP